ncbi:Molybdenum cofactor guanylyltransferase [bacterium HR40]|nr:Molybdenum cofactor guanylyltransferase [bacterium HR40]
MSGAVVGVILAGGLARRMGGGDKCLLPLGERPLLWHVIERARPQVAALALNANGDPARFASFGLPVVADGIEGFAGPLAGVLAGMDWALAQVPEADWLVTFASDTPFFPLDLVARLRAAVDANRAELACASSGGRRHPVFGLWPLALRDALERAMREEGIRKIDLFTADHRLAIVDWPVEPFDPFFNVNRPEDLDEARRLLARAF